MAEKVEKPKVDMSLSKSVRIENLRKNLEKDFGRGTLIGGNDKAKFHDHLSTGSIGLDKATGIGGLPRGRVIEIYGPESSGKTTLCLHVIAESHKDEESRCAFIDVEHAIDTMYAENLGVDLNRLDISQPDYGEQALEITHRVIETGAYDVVIVDSIAALVPKAELDAEMGSHSMGSQARMMSQALRKLTAITAKTGTILIFINQLRDKIGVMFGNPETTTGGNALKFYASVRLDIRRYQGDKAIKNGEEILGNLTIVKVIKNKMAPPFRKAEFNILYGSGIDKFSELIDMAIEIGIVQKSGSWFSYGEMKLGQGKSGVTEFFKDNEQLFEQLKLQVTQKFTPVDMGIDEIQEVEALEKGVENE